MKLVLKNNVGFCEALEIKSQSIHVTSFFNYIEVVTEQPLVVLVNDILFEVERNSNGNYIIPCNISRENHTTIQLTTTGKPLRLVVKLSDALFVGDELIDSLGDFYRTFNDWLDGESKSAEQLVEAIKSGQISLLQMVNPFTGLDYESLLDDILRVLPFALDICTRPRQHLRIEEEVLDVNLVKKITPSSLQHLASHSEHWRSRTITGLIPARLRAEVYEDDLNIYENIFFRMVIQTISKYVMQKHDEVNMAISQKDALHDWEHYATEINDFKKLQMLERLLPEYDGEEDRLEREKFITLKAKIVTIEKQLSSIITTGFFQSIDPIRMLSLPIQPTNIINMDNRYHELFKVWGKLQQLSSNKQEELSGATIANVSLYYDVYVQTLSLYVLHLLDFKFEGNSSIQLAHDSGINFSYKFSNSYCVVQVKSERTELCQQVVCTFEESLHYAISVPDDFPVSFGDYVDPLVVTEHWEGEHQLIFRKKPSLELEKALSLVVKKNMEADKNLTNAQKIALKNIDTLWRKRIADECAKIPQNRSFELVLQSVFSAIGESERSVRQLTNQLFQTATESERTTILLMPIELQKFENLEQPVLLQRLVNFGEAFLQEDAMQFGNYQVGLLPVSQKDLKSIQRLTKLFNLYMYRQLIQWGKELAYCPGCESDQIQQVDADTWQCRQLDCQLVWGKTRCTSGCESYYEWMKPHLRPRSIKQTNEEIKNPMLRKILVDEVLFDRLVLTAFDYHLGGDGVFRYAPKCPKCGTSSMIKEKV